MTEMGLESLFSDYKMPEEYITLPLPQAFFILNTYLLIYLSAYLNNEVFA